MVTSLVHRYLHVRPLVLATSLFLSTLVAPAFAQSPAAPAHATQSAENEATHAVDAFMAALASGKLDSARQAMTPDAVVIANGTVLGTRDGYIDGAAKADAVAMQSVRSRELLHRDSRLGAQLGWVVSEKRMVGEGAGQMRTMLLTETFLLTKTATGWKISGIHWSSRPAG
ncbi:DUF4440 domain-containing protein [Lysobacter sp. HX-5-24]|uniref:DUF4440 domain-containing protein n=1 Tax=Noviluteimonas gilva TaxID=2682097 RepID=A0A7C9LNF3_9GAMM|nr:nuclear transport factor 2 family protein [Lysobacter gilvus]MUV15784.1 DUF4440 domain-containing protein [Lysobacter gilvus]